METQLPGGVQLNTHDPLRLNVGFMLHESVGFSRNFDFDLPEVAIEDIQLAAFSGNASLTRTAQGLYAQGEFTAISPSQCVRCLGEYDQQLAAELSELFAYPPASASDPQLAVSVTGILDLIPILRDCFLLAVPLQLLCNPDCKALCAICGNDRNQAACDHPEAEVDPRFEVLKSLLPKQ